MYINHIISEMNDTENSYSENAGKTNIEETEKPSSVDTGNLYCADTRKTNIADTGDTNSEATGKANLEEMERVSEFLETETLKQCLPENSVDVKTVDNVNKLETEIKSGPHTTTNLGIKQAVEECLEDNDKDTDGKIIVIYSGSIN